MVRILILLLVFGTPALGGPWPRGKGKVFYSVHVNGEYLEEFGIIRQYGSLYAEYGLTDRITLGVDYNGSEIITEKAIAFVRIPIAMSDQPLRFAVELGAGLVEGERVIRPGFSVGRGITLWQRHGWLTLDTRALMGSDVLGRRIEVDATFGLSLSERFKVILQLQGGMPSKGEDYLKFAPSVVYELTGNKPEAKRRWLRRLFQGKSRRGKARKGKHFLELGVTTGISNYENYSAKIGIWREF